METSMNHGETIKVWLEKTDNEALVICPGEGNYPNASSRKIKQLNNHELLFSENGDGRTLSLLRNNREVLILLLKDRQGVKLKGKIHTIDDDSYGDAAVELMKSEGKSYASIFAVKVVISEVFPL